jgi:hypothetical protein
MRLRGLYHKTFTVVMILQPWVIFLKCCHFNPSLIFASKGGALPSGARAELYSNG